MAATSDSGWQLCLLGRWELLLDGRPVRVTTRQQRLIAMLAILPARPRAVLAGLLWPESHEVQAAGNLRAAIWRIQHELPGLLECVQSVPRLSGEVSVDLKVLTDLADSVERPDWAYAAGEVAFLCRADLLPGWYEEWITPEQERIRALRLAVLQRVSQRMIALGNPRNAMDAAMAALSIEPLSETSEFLVIQAEVALGDHAVAARNFERFRTRLNQELGIEPAHRIRQLLGSESDGPEWAESNIN